MNSCSSSAQMEPPNAELEPQLKYEQLGEDVQGSIIARDRVSCLCLSDKILALGTESGSIHVLDYSGNEVRHLKHHRARVNDLSFDRDEEHLASCSEDCSVAVLNLYSDAALPTRYEYKHPVQTVAIDPSYSQRKTKELVIGGAVERQVTFSTQGWLGRSEYSLYEGSGVQLVKWSGQLIAWASDKGVWIYDTSSHNIIRIISRPGHHETNKGKHAATSATPHASAASSPARPAASLAAGPAASLAARLDKTTKPSEAAGGGKVSLIFGQNKMLYIGWPDCIKIAKVYTSENNVGAATPGVEVVSEIRTPYYVLGVSPFGADLAVLSYPLDDDRATDPSRSGASDPSRQPSVSCTLKVAPSGDLSMSLCAREEQAPAAALPSSHAFTPKLGKAPELRIISVRNEQFAVDALPISGAEAFGPMDYCLVPSLPATSAAATSTTLKRDWGIPANAMSLFYASVYSASASATTSTATAATPTPHHHHASSPAGVHMGSSGDPEGHSSGNTGPVGPHDPHKWEANSGLSSYAAGQEYMYFIVSPKDILVGRTRDSQDRITWLIGRRRFEEALLIAEGDRSLPHDIYDNVVHGYINDLMTREAFDTAAQLSRRLLKDDVNLWETWVQLFANKRQLTKLAPFLPTDSPCLRHTAYEMALTSLLPAPEDHPKLFDLVKGWPSTIYSAPTLVDAVVGRMKRAGGETEALWNLLAHLYSLQGRPDLSLSIYLQLLSPIVFDFIEKHALVASLMGRAAPLMEINEAAALRLLIKHCDIILPSEVVPSLQEALEQSSGKRQKVDLWRRRLHNYLAGVFREDQNLAGEYHELQVQLIADYSPNKLMEFLTTSQYYPLEGALAVCEEKGMVPEQVFILGRMGNATKALHLIIEKLGDIPQAIDFVNDQRDDDLWDYLISWALRSPVTTGSLLDHVGGHINPLTLLKRIPKGLPIPKLRNRIRSIIQDYRTQTSLHEGCNVILRSDCTHLIKELYRQSRQAVTSVYAYLPALGPHRVGQWYSNGKMSTHVGSLTPVPHNKLPACVVDSVLSTNDTPADARASSSAHGHPRKASEALIQCLDVPLWMGFNLENAATHIKLAKEEVYSTQHLSTPRGSGRQGKQGKKDGRQRATAAEEGATRRHAAERTPHHLPSLVMH